MDYDTIETLNFQIITDNNQITELSDLSGLYFAGSIGLSKEGYELLFLSRDYEITSGNIISFNVTTYTTNYLKYIKKKFTEINIELGQESLNTKAIILRDTALACPKVYIDGLPPQEIESNNYYNKQEVDELIASNMSQSDWNQTDSEAPDFIKNKPTDISAFNNDVGYLTTETDPVFTATSGQFELKSEAFDGDYNSLTNKPTKVSDFTNDVGYITGFTEEDPVYKSTSGQFELKSEAFDGDYNSLTNKPTKLSDFNNDEGFITGYIETDPIYSAASGRIVFLNYSNKIPKQYYVTNKQYVKTDPIVYESDSINSFDLVYDPNYEIFINTISLTDNILNLGQIEFVNSDLEVGEAVTFEHWLKFENNTDANTIMIDNNIVVADDMPDSLSGTLTHVLVRRLYKESSNTVKEYISYAFSF